MDVGVVGEEPRAQPHQSRFRRRDLEIGEQAGREQLIDQDAVVLRIIAELDDVPLAVVGLHQVRLGASSHFSDVPDGGERHRLEIG